MGRELRRVPPNWEHPKKEGTNVYKPLFNENYLTALNKWWENHQLWLKREHPDQVCPTPEAVNDTPKYFAEWDGDPPAVDSYRQYTDDEATWYQWYETVTEGTPLTPPFETAEEVAQYLATYGDFWYQQDQREQRPAFGFPRFRTKPTLEQARAMVEAGFAMFTITVKDSI